MNRSLIITALLIAVLSASSLISSCDEDTAAPPVPKDNGIHGTMTAMLNNKSWKSTQIEIFDEKLYGRTPPTPAGTIIIFGNSKTSRIGLELSFISGQGTFPLGVNPETTAGGTGSVMAGGATSWTGYSTVSGSVTITVRTANRIAGTFNFRARESYSTPHVDYTVANGAFDIVADNGLPPLPTPYAIAGDGR